MKSKICHFIQKVKTVGFRGLHLLNSGPMSVPEYYGKPGNITDPKVAAFMDRRSCIQRIEQASRRCSSKRNKNAESAFLFISIIGGRLRSNGDSDIYEQIDIEET